MKPSTPHGNIDPLTVRGFGDEWETFDQAKLTESEFRALFDRYFSIFPFDQLPAHAVGFDLGCGSGRWAAGVAPRVGTLHCIDASDQALSVARKRLGSDPRVRFHHASVDDIPVADGSQDFGYSLGVLHHVPNTAAAIHRCAEKLRPGAPFLLYIYYRFDNRPGWFVAIWRASNLFRKVIARMPFPIRRRLTDTIAAVVYWPLARIAGGLERLGIDVVKWPLSAYRACSFYTMRTDALDRFGTRLEQRFTRGEIERMMIEAGLENVIFSDDEPYWVACGRRAR